MKYKYLFLSFMLLILVGSITAIAADEASIGGYTFTLPDGYTITNQTEDLISLSQDDDHAIIISDPDVVKSSEEFKADLEAQGYEFGDEANYTSGNFDIEQYNYKSDPYKGFLYICHDNTDDNEVFLITLVIPGDEDAPSEDDNPVSTILSSFTPEADD